jgi:[ribosomal protein S5]-alanine N-acetyltransferase
MTRSSRRWARWPRPRSRLLPDVVTTERLAGRRPRLGDAEALAGVVADEAVVPTLWVDGAPTAGRVHAWLAGDLRHWQHHGFGPYLWADRADATGAILARGGLRHTRVAGEDFVEIAYALVGARWGEGLATEIARASVRAAFDELVLDEVVAYTLPTNAASRRVMEKAGLRYERPIEHVGLPHVLYRISRSEAHTQRLA